MDPAADLEVNVDVVSEDVHAEKLAAADLAGVLLISVGQQMLVHVAAAGEHLNTHTHTHTHTHIYMVHFSVQQFFFLKQFSLI